jgi:hypothetical protein
LLDGEHEQDENKEFADAIDGEDGINILSDDEGCNDFLKANTRKISHSYVMITTPPWRYPQEYLMQSIPTKFEVPDNFKQLIWNEAGSSPGSMIILL